MTVRHQLGDLDLRDIITAVREEDGDLVLVVADGDGEVRFEQGAGGEAADAVLGALEVARAANQFAARVAMRLGIELPGLPPVERTWWEHPSSDGPEFPPVVS